MSELPDVLPGQVWRSFEGWYCVTGEKVVVGGLCEECEKFGEEREAVTFRKLAIDTGQYCWPIERWHELVEEPDTGEMVRRFTLAFDYRFDC